MLQDGKRVSIDSQANLGRACFSCNSAETKTGDEIEFQIREDDEDDGNPALELVDDFQDVDVVGSGAVR